METNLITKEQLDKLVERIEAEFPDYFASDKKSEVGSFKECFYMPEIYKKEKLLTLDQKIFKQLPKEIQEKAHELIAGFTKVD